MAKTWVLDTDTKGTGANMVPLEKLLRRGGKQDALATVTFTPPPPEPAEPIPERQPPLRFRVTDVLSGRELARDIGARAVVGLLEGMRSVLDARVYLWIERCERWRLLTLEDHRRLWQFRGQLPD